MAGRLSPKERAARVAYWTREHNEASLALRQALAEGDAYGQGWNDRWLHYVALRLSRLMGTDPDNIFGHEGHDL